MKYLLFGLLLASLYACNPRTPVQDPVDPAFSLQLTGPDGVVHSFTIDSVQDYAIHSYPNLVFPQDPTATSVALFLDVRFSLQSPTLTGPIGATLRFYRNAIPRALLEPDRQEYNYTFVDAAHWRSFFFATGDWADGDTYEATLYLDDKRLKARATDPVAQQLTITDAYLTVADTGEELLSVAGQLDVFAHDTNEIPSEYDWHLQDAHFAFTIDLGQFSE